MKQDIDKIKAAIKAAKKFQPQGTYDHALYATYLYAVRSQYRSRLHMREWNKHHPRTMNLDLTQTFLEGPRSAGKVEFTTLDQQAAWIAYVRAYILKRQEWNHSSNDWRLLCLDFDKAPEPVVEGEPEQAAVG